MYVMKGYFGYYRPCVCERASFDVTMDLARLDKPILNRLRRHNGFKSLPNGNLREIYHCVIYGHDLSVPVGSVGITSGQRFKRPRASWDIVFAIDSLAGKEGGGQRDRGREGKGGGIETRDRERERERERERGEGMRDRGRGTEEGESSRELRGTSRRREGKEGGMERKTCRRRHGDRGRGGAGGTETCREKKEREGE